MSGTTLLRPRQQFSAADIIAVIFFIGAFANMGHFAIALLLAFTACFG
jgi:hypothetical protein